VHQQAGAGRALRAILRAMIRLGNSTRFTRHEVDEFRQVGLDMGNVKHQEDIEQELSRWAHILADERFDLLEKVALEMAKAKGAKLPAKLRVMMQARRHACTATK
jgi:hypothetical protein